MTEREIVDGRPHLVQMKLKVGPQDGGLGGREEGSTVQGRLKAMLVDSRCGGTAGQGYWREHRGRGLCQIRIWGCVWFLRGSMA